MFLVEALEDEPDLDRTADLILLRLDLEPEDVELVRDAGPRPRPALVGRPPARGAHRGARPRARRTPRHAGPSPHPVRVERPAQRGPRTLGDAAPSRALRPGAGDVGGRRPGGGGARVLAERRKAKAADLIPGSPGALERLESPPAPTSCGHRRTALARHAALLDPRPPASTRGGHLGGRGRVVGRRGVARRRRPLAAITKVLADLGLVGRRRRPRHLARRRRARLVPRAPRSAAGSRGARRRPSRRRSISHDIPRHPRRRGERGLDGRPHGTRCARSVAPIGPAAARFATEFAAARIEVGAAQVTARRRFVIDRFEVTDRDGAKLSTDDIDRLTGMTAAGVTARRCRFSRRLVVRAGAQP